MMVTLPQEERKLVETLAERRGQSLSQTASDLIRFALNLQEDLVLGEIIRERLAESREKLSHEEVWNE